MVSLFIDARFAPTRSLIVAISCAMICGIVFGLSMPLISLRLEEMTGSGLIVGLNGAVAALSTLVMAPIVPRLMTWLPPRAIMLASFSGAAGLFVLLPVFPDVAVWFVLRFLIGCFVTVVFVLSETWINQIVSPERRAMMLGVYGTALSGGFGLGGVAFSALHAAGDMAFYLGAAIFLLGVLPVIFLNGPQATAPDSETSTFKATLNALWIAPAAILAALAFGALETLIFSMMPVYADRIGFDRQMIGYMVVAVAMGALAFQIPVGWIADKTNRRATLVWIAACAAVTPILIGFAGQNLGLLLPLLFLQAGVASGLYTVGLSLLGERFSGGAIAAANAAFIFAYGFGSLFAPPLAGQAMDSAGPQGLLWTLSAIAALYTLIVISRSLLRRSKS
ncbi:MFS transporter [Maricaulis sp.]|uniref:MFS transporter n=1 Tax=Maricaulis sp. TaxID=1486257 RepID=UPI00262790DD|nr:MFS transporter [Maricaulis sp.]